MSIDSARDALKLKQALRKPHLRLHQFRQIIDRKMAHLNDIVEMIAPNYQKTWIPHQRAEPARALYRLTNLMSSNPREINTVVKSTNPKKVALGQKLEWAQEAIDGMLFPQTTFRRMYQFLADSYALVALDVVPARETLAKLSDRAGLEAYAEGDSEDGTDAQASYKDAYLATNTEDAAAKRHEDAYAAATTEALIADGLCVRVRNIDPAIFDGFQIEGDTNRFSIGMESGRKPLSPLMEAFKEYGLSVDNGHFVIREHEEDGTVGKAYQALGKEVQPTYGSSISYATSELPGQSYVEYTQIRTCEETVILIEHPKGADRDYAHTYSGNGIVIDECGVLIKLPNVFGGVTAGYYLVEGDAKLRGTLEDSYDPPLLQLMVESQHLAITQSAYEAMALEEATRPLYNKIESDASRSVEPFDPTEETKVDTPTNDGTIATTSGEIRRAETTGVKLEHVIQKISEDLQRAEPNELISGSGKSESALHLAYAQTAMLTDLSPYQANVASVCKAIHMDLLAYVGYSGDTIKVAYVPANSPKGTKAEVREITPEMAKLPIDMEYSIGASTPAAKYAEEQMSFQRVLGGVVGMTTHRETIGIKDPQAEESRMAEDLLVSALVGTQQAPGLMHEAYLSVMKDYLAASIAAKLGPPPQPQQQPALLDQFGNPMPPSVTTPAGGAPAGGVGGGGIPGSVAPPVAPNPQGGAAVGGPPAVPGGMAVTV